MQAKLTYQDMYLTSTHAEFADFISSTFNFTNLRLVYSFSRISSDISSLSLRSDTLLKQIQVMEIKFD